MSTPDAIIAALDLQPHPEGGWYGETFRAPPGPDGRAASTAIYFLLKRGERSHWHRVIDADEIWHHYAGAPLALEMACPDGIHGMADGTHAMADGIADTIECHTLGPDVLAGQRPQAVVPAGRWQSARSLGDWTLCGCTVAPGFDFAAFELAPPGWAPGFGS